MGFLKKLEVSAERARQKAMNKQHKNRTSQARTATPRRGTAHLGSRWLFAVVAALLAFVSACGSSDLGIATSADTQTNDPANTSVAQEQPTAATSGDDGPSTDVALGELAVEADPSAPARLSLKAAGSAAGETIVPVVRPEIGASWQGDMSMTLGIAVDGQKLPVPVIVMSMTVVVTDVDDEGIWTSEGRITGAEIGNPEDFSSAEISAVEDAFVGIDQLSFVQDTDQYGVVQNVEVFGLENLAPEVAASMDIAQQAESMTVTVPTQEVGVGASWTDTNKLVQNGIEFDLVTTYTITDIDGDTYTLAIDYEQTIDDTATMEGVDVAMVGTIVGSGTSVIDINVPSPINSQLDASGTIDASAEGTTFGMDMDISILISSN